MSINQALGAWLAELQEQWFAPVHPPLGLWRRFLYAFAGAFFWAVYVTVLIVSQDAMPEVPDIPLFPAFEIENREVATIAIVGIPAVFAWLVSWPNRPYSPTRLFLGGLLLPALATALARLSLLEWVVQGGAR